MTDAPRRILATADLHWGLYDEGDDCTRRLAQFAAESGADALIIAGDVADSTDDGFVECLSQFEAFDGPRMLVPGNHDVWAPDGPPEGVDGSGSMAKYQRALPAQAQHAGFHMLDGHPLRLGPVAFVGTMGWYDYSLRNPALDVTPEQYESKELPGICTWNDVRYVDWAPSDGEFTEGRLRQLKADCLAVADGAQQIVAVMHHLPLRELMYGPMSRAFEFTRAYMGSQRFGRLLQHCPGVRHVLCGHRHSPARARVGNLDAVCVGSRYRMKRLIDLDLETDNHRVHTFTAPDERGEPHHQLGEVA